VFMSGKRTHRSSNECDNDDDNDNDNNDNAMCVYVRVTTDWRAPPERVLSIDVLTRRPLVRDCWKLCEHSSSSSSSSRRVPPAGQGAH